MWRSTNDIYKRTIRDREEGVSETVCLTFREENGEQTPMMAERIVYTEGDRKYIKHIGKKVYLNTTNRAYPSATVNRR